MITPRKGKIRTPDVEVAQLPGAPGNPGRLLVDIEAKRLYLDNGQELVPIGQDLTSLLLEQVQIRGDTNEDASWDSPSSLKSNLNRIRYVLSQITGGAWNAVTASLSWLKSRFHPSSGHTHSGGADDAPPIPWNNISGKPSAFPPQAHGSTHAPGSSDALPTAAPSGGLGTANAEGTSAAFARADHVHLAFDNTNPANVGSTPSPGTSTVAARRDHVHALADGVVTDAKIGNRTVSDASAPTSDTGTLTTLLSGLAYMIKAITGKANWRTVPAINLEALAAHKSRHATGGADALSPQDIGAAPASHSHAAGDITSGRLSLSRLPSGPQGTVLAGAGDGQDPYWTTLPGGVQFWEFTSNGTWYKPSTGSLAIVQVVGGGAGGGRGTFDGRGGGGGAGVIGIYKLSDLPSQVAITVGAGGQGATSSTPPGNGGASSFGDYIVAYGGSGSNGGGLKGGNFGAAFDGGRGAYYSASSDVWHSATSSLFGGGGGGGYGSTTPGTSTFAGAGGAGSSSGAGGNGQFPGGGGGGGYTQGGNGAPGVVRIWVI